MDIRILDIRHEVIRDYNGSAYSSVGIGTQYTSRTKYTVMASVLDRDVTVEAENLSDALKHLQEIEKILKKFHKKWYEDE